MLFQKLGIKPFNFFFQSIFHSFTHIVGHLSRQTRNHVLNACLNQVNTHCIAREAGAFGQLIDQPAFYAGLGVEAQNTALALILFFLVAPLFTFPLTPLTSLLSRRHEYEADAYAAEQTSAADLAHALVKLYEDNAATLTPDPLHSLFYDSHPPAALRVTRLSA